MSIQTPLLTVVQAIVKEAEKTHPGTELLYRQGRLRLDIRVQSFEHLVIETRKPEPRYSEEKFHIMIGYYPDGYPDPEISMTNEGIPFYMRQTSLDGVRETRAMWKTQGQTPLIDLNQQGEILSIARLWARNLREQGFVRKAREAQVSDLEKVEDR